MWLLLHVWIFCRYIVGVGLVSVWHFGPGTFVLKSWAQCESRLYIATTTKRVESQSLGHKYVCPHLWHPCTMQPYTMCPIVGDILVICMGHMAWAPEGHRGQSQEARIITKCSLSKQKSWGSIQLRWILLCKCLIQHLQRRIYLFYPTPKINFSVCSLIVDDNHHLCTVQS